MAIFVLLWTLLPTPTDGVRGFTAATRLGGHNLARRRCATPRFCYTEPDPELDLEIDGPSLNEELTVSVQYLGGADSRQRRVRRTNRPPAEERWRLSTEEATDGSGNYIYRRMSAFCNYASIDVEAAIDLIANNEAFRRFGDSISITSYSDVVHVRMTSPPTSATASTTAMRSIVRDAYLLPYGATVLWGFQSRDELDFIDLIAPCSEPLSSVPYSGDMASEDLGDSDFMLYTLDDAPEPSDTPAECATDGGMSPPSPEQLARDDATGRRGSATVSLSAGAVTLSNKLIRISSTDDPVEKLAISFAFAQSVKLGFFEALLESTTEAIKPIPEQLAAKGSTNIDIKQVAKLTGRLFLERNEVNLYSNILDIPDFFWEAEEFEPLYLRVSRYLDIDDRVVILNKRLDIVNDLLDSLSAQLEVEHANRLEWIIIWLISVEIALELLKDFGGVHGGIRLLGRGWQLLKRPAVAAAVAAAAAAAAAALAWRRRGQHS
jgi:uncharacterized Rmd1/YagE family protein